jgi:hypothetical protein
MTQHWGLEFLRRDFRHRPITSLFFGFFLLVKQKKEIRLSVREPIPKKLRKAFHFS